MSSEDFVFNSFDSLAVGSEWKPAEDVRPINVPIYSSSTFKVSSVAHGEALSNGKVGTLLSHLHFHNFGIFLQLTAYKGVNAPAARLKESTIKKIASL